MKVSPLRPSVLRALRSSGFSRPGETVVCALSGGADSVALLDLLVSCARELEARVVAAHLDHGLRPGSAEDAAFCAMLCQRLAVPYETRRVDVAAGRLGLGVEGAAREARYAFLREVKTRVGARLIAVAHTRDDQAETVLLRLLRGSGSLGLAAMRRRSGDLLRPLLETTRREIVAYLGQRQLPWREDPSNADQRYVRNRVRHELLPYLEGRFNPALRAALARTARLLADEQEVLDEAADELFARLARREGDTVILNRSPLQLAPRALARLAIRRALAEAGGLRGIGAGHVEAILDLVAAGDASGRRLPLPGRREVLFRFGDVVIGERQAAADPFVVPLPVPGSVAVPGGWVISTTACPDLVAGPQADARPRGEAPPLVVRTRRPGDRIRVGQREISLKRFWMQARVPFDLRGALPLVASGGQVLWAPGLPNVVRRDADPGPIKVTVSRATHAPQRDA